MRRLQSIVFVLWSSHFDEASAAIFVSELRGAGLLVKVVGLRGLYAAGRHGLALTPDLTLGQALTLACRASCVVLPCPAQGFTPLKNDPRLLDFFRQAEASQALFVLSQDALGPQGTALSDLIGLGQMVSYPPLEALVIFVREIGCELAQRKT